MSYDASHFRHYIEHDFTYIAGFARNLGRFGKRTALIDPATGREWTYRELGAEVDRLASALAGLGVGRGDCVVYALFNGPEFALCYLATQRIGAIGVPVNYRLAAGELAYILTDSAPRVLIYDTALADTVATALAQAPVHHVLAVGSASPLPGAQAFAAVLAGASGEVPPLPAPGGQV